MNAESASPAGTSSGAFLSESRPNALEEVTAALQGAAVIRSDVPKLEVSGSGAVDCMQGLVTVDLTAHRGTDVQYGALLTAKGMIVCDMWIAVVRDSLGLYPDPAGVAQLLSVLNRSIPPKLAKITNLCGERVVFRIIGPQALTLTQGSGFVVPPEGDVVTDKDLTITRPKSGAPFSIQIDCMVAEADRVLSALSATGILVSSRDALELQRILAGWPRLGAEIDDKTLPQEVRYNELGGVSYTKGCYLGQETVARLHYRGHTNKRMLGLMLDSAPSGSDRKIRRGEQTVGRLTSAAWFGPEHGYLGLGVVRNEVSPGERVTAGGAAAETSTLPFEFAHG